MNRLGLLRGKIGSHYSGEVSVAQEYTALNMEQNLGEAAPNWALLEKKSTRVQQITNYDWGNHANDRLSIIIYT